MTAFASRLDGAEMTYEDRDYRLEVELDGATAAPLKAPSHGRMVARADESLDATMRVRLTSLEDGAVLLDDCGLHAGCEVMDTKASWRPGSGIPSRRATSGASLVDRPVLPAQPVAHDRRVQLVGESLARVRPARSAGSR